MKLFFDLLKRVRKLNFQKKLVKKLTQLIFQKFTTIKVVSLLMSSFKPVLKSIRHFYVDCLAETLFLHNPWWFVVTVVEKWNSISSLKVGQVQAMILGQLKHYIVSVTWLNRCHTTASNNKSLFQKVTKLCLMRSKNQKLKKNALLPTNYTEIPSLTTHKYRNEIIFWFAKMSKKLKFSEKAR